MQILAVSADNHEESKKFGEMLSKRFDGEFDFPLLEDKDHKVINRYGIFNPDGRGWPHPSTFVIDPKGTRWGWSSTKNVKVSDPTSSSHEAIGIPFAQAGNWTIAALPSGPVGQDQLPNPRVTRPDPLYSVEQLARLVKSVDQGTRDCVRTGCR